MKPAALLTVAVLVLAAVGGVLWVLLSEPPADDGLPGVSGPGEAAPLDPSPAPEPAPRARLEPSTAGAGEGGGARPMLDGGDTPALLEGSVVDRAGDVQAGALVELLRATRDGLATRFSPTTFVTEADTQGRFQLVGVPIDGPLAVEASAPGFAPTLGATIELEPGEARDLGQLVLTRGTQLTGRVSDPDDQPIAGARIRVVDMGRDPAPGADSVAAAETLTGEDGRYVLPDLARRQYQVEASHDGYARVAAVLSFVLGSPDSSWANDFVLEPADRQLGGQLISSDDLPAAGVRVRLIRKRDRSYFDESRTTDADGRFLFEALPGGRYDLSLLSDDVYLPAPKRLEAGRDDHVVRVQRALVVNGRLVTEGATPLPRRFDVRVRPDGRTGATVLDPERHLRSYVDSDPPGSFRFDGLRPGTYAFEVVAPGFAVTRSADAVIAQNTPEVDLVVPLMAGGTLRGRLVPVPPAARVELRDGAWDPSLAIEHAFPTPPLHGLVTTSDADGAFEFRHVPPGAYVLSAFPQGNPPLHVRAVNVVEGRELDLGALALQLGGRVAGSVLAVDGRPSPGAQVSLLGDDLHERVAADAAGLFAFPSVPPGHYRLVASPPGLWDALKFEAKGSVEVRADATTEVQLDMAPRELPGDG